MVKTKVLFAAALAAILAAGLSCSENRPPDVPAVPTGPEHCLKDATGTFKTTVNDPDGDSMAVRFDWGDSTTSHWLGWFASGETIEFTHAWSDTGTFYLRATAQDRKLLTSEPSDSLPVRVLLRRPPDAPTEPVGKETGGQDSSYNFVAGASHPDAISVAIRFAWGDGDTSDWSPFTLPGGPVKMSHAWSAPDTYAVRAQAKDTGGLTSPWSSPHYVAIRPPDTLRRWRVRLAVAQGSHLSSSPAIAPDGTIYVGSPDSALYAVNPDRTVKWRYMTNGGLRSSPAVAGDGTVYVGSNDNCLHAVAPDGTLRWKYVSGDSIISSPAIAGDGTVYIGSLDGALYAVNPDGSLRWRYLTGGGIKSSPAIAADGTVYFGSSDGYLYAVTPDSVLKWRYLTDVTPEPAIAADGTVYVGSSAREVSALYALNRDGTLKWQHWLGGAISSSPAIAVDGTIYVASACGWGVGPGLWALNPDGTTRWSFSYDEGSWQPAPGRIGGSSPAVSAHGTIYFGSYGSFYALYPDGTLKWRYDTDARVESSPTIGSDGTIYFASDDGYLYALKGTSPLADSPWPKFHHDLQNTGRAIGSPGRLRMVGQPLLLADSSGFRIYIVNDGNAGITIGALEFFDTPDSAYMRHFCINGNPGYGYPVQPGQPGTGPGDTAYFAPQTILPDDMVELMLMDFYVDPAGVLTRSNVHGKTFRFRFSDGSDIIVEP